MFMSRDIQDEGQDDHYTVRQHHPKHVEKEQFVFPTSIPIATHDEYLLGLVLTYRVQEYMVPNYLLN